MGIFQLISREIRQVTSLIVEIIGRVAAIFERGDVGYSYIKLEIM